MNLCKCIKSYKNQVGYKFDEGDMYSYIMNDKNTFMVYPYTKKSNVIFGFVFYNSKNDRLYFHKYFIDLEKERDESINNILDNG